MTLPAKRQGCMYLCKKHMLEDVFQILRMLADVVQRHEASFLPADGFNIFGVRMVL